MIRSSHRSIIRLDLRGKERFSYGCTAPPEPLIPLRITVRPEDSFGPLHRSACAPLFGRPRKEDQ